MEMAADGIIPHLPGFWVSRFEPIQAMWRVHKRCQASPHSRPKNETLNDRMPDRMSNGMSEYIHNNHNMSEYIHNMSEYIHIIYS